MNSKRGLYQPSFEHDACGIGFLADINGKPAHSIVKDALGMLGRLNHRAGQNDDTGDGAGILTQIPDRYFRYNLSFELPTQGDYAVGMLFMPQDPDLRQHYRRDIEHLITTLPLTISGWRIVPVNEKCIGEKARKNCPFIMQLFIEKEKEMDTKTFERHLYVARKKIEKLCPQLYIASFSSQTIVYKGMIKPERLTDFYLDLGNSLFTSALALVHSRFSTNTFPSWDRAHPNRCLVHNGEVNTLQGNVNWMRARIKQMETDIFGVPVQELMPIINEDGSDSAVLDNVLEFLSLGGRSLPHAAMMLVPEPWEQDTEMDALKRSFYEYHNAMMEPWDGPMAISYTDGKQIGAMLDRNGLRPGRYYLTKDDRIIFSSEYGVVDVPGSEIKEKRRLKPGELLLVDTEEGRIIPDEEFKQQLSLEQPYEAWLNQEKIQPSVQPQEVTSIDEEKLVPMQKAFGYTYEEVMKGIKPMVTEAKDPIGSMGDDKPLAVLSERPQLLYNYFKQWFAQVTNPPIDAIRESFVTSTITWLGPQQNIMEPASKHTHRIQLDRPIINESMLDTLQSDAVPFESKKLSLVYHAKFEYGETVLEQLFEDAEQAIASGCGLIVLSDRGVNRNYVALPALLAVSGLHHHLIKKGLRTKVSLIVETGEGRDVHQMATLLGYGADVICPYLGIATIHHLLEQEHITDISPEDAVETYLNTLSNGVVKVMSKIGISTVASYRGAQTFEAVGIGQQVIDRFFTGTVSQIGGLTLEEIVEEALVRHRLAYKESKGNTLEAGSDLQWRRGGDHHRINPKTIHTLQQAARTNDYELYKTFSEQANKEALTSVRDLLTFDKNRNPVPLEKVESVEDICSRFKTGAMSFGALSQEAHEALAIAMNRIGGKSNSGEGGEAADRYTPDEDGDFRRSAIKQVASGRFGVTSHYLSNADEIQIKMAQGAKPGEGGQLPAHKVYPWVAEVRGTTPGVGLISPPPHHDIYSIEDLAQLIHDLKRANPGAKINVKLVAKSGVGTIAAGVAKGLADVILISGHDGGTGASPRGSIKHAGLPWELGLAEAHQTLMLNGLRERVTLETDGKLMTGKDVVIAACLGAEEYGFSTAPLIVLGCVMMRACHLDTCPVGVATQNPELRKRMMGSPDHIVNYMTFIAQEIREILAQLGFKTLNELIGKTSVLKKRKALKEHPKAKYLDLSALLNQDMGGAERRKIRDQEHELDQSFDYRELLPYFHDAIKAGTPYYGAFSISNTDRAAGTVLGHHLSKYHGESGLKEDTLRIHCKGSAGQSFGAFVPRGITMTLEGDANDYIGKGLSGGKLIVTPDMSMDHPDNQALVGNVAFFGATGGQVYIRGKGGERFCVRNSGVHAVVEGIGDHGCEYMTGGRVVVLGDIGKNFAAGMSGGVAYVINDEKEEDFNRLVNQELVQLQTVTDQDEMDTVKSMVETHYQLTESPKAFEALRNWSTTLKKIRKVIPTDYQYMLRAIETLKAKGRSEEEAILEAFNMKKAGQKLPDPQDEEVQLA